MSKQCIDLDAAARNIDDSPSTLETARVTSHRSANIFTKSHDGCNNEKKRETEILVLIYKVIPRMKRNARRRNVYFFTIEICTNFTSLISPGYSRENEIKRTREKKMCICISLSHRALQFGALLSRTPTSRAQFRRELTEFSPTGNIKILLLRR